MSRVSGGLTAHWHKDGYVVPKRYEKSDEDDVTSIKINVRTVFFGTKCLQARCLQKQ